MVEKKAEQVFGMTWDNPRMFFVVVVVVFLVNYPFNVP